MVYLTLAPGSADAANATASFNVAVTVQPTCTIAASNLSFPVYTGVIDTATSTITLTCTNTTPYNIGLNAGTASGATVSSRSMTGSGVVMTYGLFRDAAYTLNWGVTVGTDTVASSGNGGSQIVTVYGQIPAGEYVNPGSYTDTVVATVTY